MIEREIISIENICFFDVANEIKKNEISIIDFDWLINNVNINVNLFDVKIAKNVNFAIDTMNVRFTIIVFDIKKNIDITISFDINFANSFNENIVISFANFSNFF